MVSVVRFFVQETDYSENQAVANQHIDTFTQVLKPEHKTQIRHVFF